MIAVLTTDDKIEYAFNGDIPDITNDILNVIGLTFRHIGNTHGNEAAIAFSRTMARQMTDINYWIQASKTNKDRRNQQMTLTEMAQNLNALHERKAELEQEEKEVKAAIDAAKKEMSDKFLEDDVDSISVGGYNFSPKAKTAYSKRSEEALAEAGLVFFDVLRKAGLGNIIVPTVNAKTLQATITAYVDEHGALDGDLARAISAYDYIDIARTKVQIKKRK